MDRVRALPEDKRSSRPAHGEFSPIEVIMHIALAEGFDLERIQKTPEGTFAGMPSKPSFFFKKALQTMARAQKVPTFKLMTPDDGTTFAQAEAAWADVRSGCAKVFEQIKDPHETLVKLPFFGRLSTLDLLDLFEVHTHYHEARFPQA
jgi:hypothetical protein